MRRLIALALLAVGGCTATCKDGWRKNTVISDSTFVSCDFECCRKEKDCSCSKTCPCWNQSTHPKP
jgi:hypothetical protein